MPDTNTTTINGQNYVTFTTSSFSPFALVWEESVGSPLPMTAAVQEIFQWLHNNGCGQDDHSSIIKYYKKLTGIESL